jgi:hypothetical protein
MLKLGAGYYAVMDRATSLGQLVARNERQLSTRLGHSGSDQRRPGRADCYRSPFSDGPLNFGRERQFACGAGDHRIGYTQPPCPRRLAARPVPAPPTLSPFRLASAVPDIPRILHFSGDDSPSQHAECWGFYAGCTALDGNRICNNRSSADGRAALAGAIIHIRRARTAGSR